MIVFPGTLLNVTCPVYGFTEARRTLDQSLYTRYQTNMTMLNWSPCIVQVQVDPLKILKEAEKKFLYSPEKKANKKAGL